MWNSRRVRDPPPVRAIVAEEHRVRVDLLENLEVARRLNLEDRLRPRAEALDLLARVRRGERLGRSQSSSRRRMNAVRIASVSPPFSTMTGLNLKRSVDVEDLVAVLEAEEPLPPAAIEEQPPQIAGAVVGVEAGRHDETQPAARAEQRVRLLEEQLVQVEVRRALMAERMRGVGRSRARRGAPRRHRS